MINKTHIQHHKEAGFTLVEMLITMVIALVIMGGLMLNFIQQYGEYKYQSKRIDAVQNLEFSIRFIANDLRASLRSVSGSPTGNHAITGSDPTTALSFWAWDTVNGTTSSRALRRYFFTGNVLRYDPEATTDSTAGATTSSHANDMLTNVTYFKVFEDGVTSREVSVGVPFSGIPAALGSLSVNDPSGTPQTVNGYTVLVEMAVDSGYKGGSFLDVKGVDVRTTADGRKRVWRYIQVYPMTVVD